MKLPFDFHAKPPVELFGTNVLGCLGEQSESWIMEFGLWHPNRVDVLTRW